jgi:hypothetical protein
MIDESHQLGKEKKKNRSSSTPSLLDLGVGMAGQSCQCMQVRQIGERAKVCTDPYMYARRKSHKM